MCTYSKCLFSHVVQFVRICQSQGLSLLSSQERDAFCSSPFSFSLWGISNLTLTLITNYFKHFNLNVTGYYDLGCVRLRHTNCSYMSKSRVESCRDRFPIDSLTLLRFFPMRKVKFDFQFFFLETLTLACDLTTLFTISA